MEKTSLGQMLEALRADVGVTLHGLSQTSGIPLTTLHRLFRDQVAKPNPAHLTTLAQLLRVHPRVLTATVDYPDSTPADLDAALRAAYPLPDAAIAEMHVAIDAVAARYTATAKTGETK